MENFICSRYGERLHILNTENINICYHFLPYLLNICQKIDFFISQGSVVTYLHVTQLQRVQRWELFETQCVSVNNMYVFYVNINIRVLLNTQMTIIHVLDNGNGCQIE